MTREVVFAPEAEEDLIQLYDFIEERSGQQTASDYVARVIDYCEGLSDFPERGTRRNDLWPGLRTIGLSGAR